MFDETLLNRWAICRMCIYCLEDDTPFRSRKSSGFPRKMMAEAVETDATAITPAPPGTFSCDDPEPAAPPSAWPKRKSTSLKT
jgi:hypothetical protein